MSALTIAWVLFFELILSRLFFRWSYRLLWKQNFTMIRGNFFRLSLLVLVSVCILGVALVYAGIDTARLTTIWLLISPVLVFICSYVFFTSWVRRRIAFSLLPTGFYLLFLGFFLWLVFIVRTNFYMGFSIVWKSMSPTLNQNDLVLIDKNPDVIERWDILIYVPKWKSVPFIKRVVWLPTEVLWLRKWSIYVCPNETECNKLEEPYIPVDVETTFDCKKDTFRLTEWYFMIWDNREHSTDSRCCHWSSCHGEAEKSMEIFNENIVWKVIYTFEDSWKNNIVNVVNIIFE